MSDDLDEFRQAGRAGIPPGGKTARFLENLPDDLRDRAMRAMRTPEIGAGACAKVFARWAREMNISDPPGAGAVTAWRQNDRET